jgi:hypothetical protein
VKYKCKKGGSYQLLNGYVGCIDDCRGKENTDVQSIAVCIIIGQIVGIVSFLTTNNPLIGAVVCFVVSAMLYLFIE